MNLSFYESFADNYDNWIKADDYHTSIKYFYRSFFDDNFDDEIEVVEFGIGTGEIALEIVINTKHKVFGIDNSLAMLNICKSKNNDKITLLQADITTLKFDKQKKIIYLPYRTISHFITMQDKKNVLQNIYDNLEKGGIFLFDLDVMSEEERISSHNRPHLFYENIDISVYHKYNFKSITQKIEVSVFIAKRKTKDVSVFKYDFSWISVIQMRNLLDDIGFKVLNLYGDTLKNEYTDFSTKQIWSVEK